MALNWSLDCVLIIGRKQTEGASRWPRTRSCQVTFNELQRQSEYEGICSL